MDLAARRHLLIKRFPPPPPPKRSLSYATGFSHPLPASVRSLDAVNDKVRGNIDEVKARGCIIGVAGGTARAGARSGPRAPHPPHAAFAETDRWRACRAAPGLLRRRAARHQRRPAEEAGEERDGGAGAGLDLAGWCLEVKNEMVHRRFSCSRSPVRSHRCRRRVAAGGARAEYRIFFGGESPRSFRNRGGLGCLNGSIRGMMRRARRPCTSSASTTG
jgi:hypothetical protein